jgi:hypothetical protein
MFHSNTGGLLLNYTVLQEAIWIVKLKSKCNTNSIRQQQFPCFYREMGPVFFKLWIDTAVS